MRYWNVAVWSRMHGGWIKAYRSPVDIDRAESFSALINAGDGVAFVVRHDACPQICQPESGTGAILN